MAADPQAMMMQAAQDRLEELEEKKKKKDAQDKQKEVEQLTKMMRTGQRTQDEAIACSHVICFWGIMNALFWALPLLGDNWYTKCWEGMGVDKLTIETGLFNLNIKVKCLANMVDEERLCVTYQKYASHNDGNWAIKELQDKMCSDLKDACPIMNRYYYAAFAPLVGFPAAAGFEVLSVFLLYFYWHGKPSSMVRKLAHKCSAIAPTLGGLGFVGWLAIAPHIQELPRLWARADRLEAFANGIFGMKETFMVPFGWCTFLAFMVFFSSGIKTFMQGTLGKHIHEPDRHGLDESSALMEEAQRQYDSTHPQRAA
jgi:hypothetical protein